MRDRDENIHLNINELTNHLEGYTCYKNKAGEGGLALLKRVTILK